MPVKHSAANSYVQARNYTPTQGRIIKWVVIHSMESSELSKTTENVASWFAGSNAPKASAHFCVDNDSTVQCVQLRDVAWAAPGANSEGIQIELAGRSAQTRAQWLDEYSRPMLQRAAKLTAQLCREYGIPVVRVGPLDLKRGRPGITGHVDVTNAFRRSDHTDPGPQFPWDWFLNEVKAALQSDPKPGQKAPWTVRVPGRVIARGSLNHANLIMRISAYLRDKGHKAPWTAVTIDPRNNRVTYLGTGRLWPLTAFKRKVSAALQAGYTVKLNDLVVIRKEK